MENILLVGFVILIVAVWHYGEKITNRLAEIERKVSLTDREKTEAKSSLS